jgi:hypothetical protein
MASLPRTYTNSTARDLAAKPRSRFGGPRQRRPSTAHEAWFERSTANSPFGSHMPLDIDLHWDWRNPLNIIPAMILLVIVIALLAAII